MLLTAPVSNISRSSLHDGPGIRSVVYLMGCSLRCRWCHNPENLHANPKILFAPVKCIGCKRCLAVCSEHHRLQNGEHVFLRDGCETCGQCADACPSGALTLCGQNMTTADVLKTVLKDKAYYDISGGGVTLSGGECLLYPDFVRELLSALKAEGVHTAVETALYVPWQNTEAVLSTVDLFFADLKIADPVRHRQYTGADNRLILDNLRRLTDRHPNVIVRIPLIPLVNDTAEDMASCGAILSGMGQGLKAVELLKYNPLADAKYAMTGLSYTDFGRDSQSAEALDALKAALKQALPASVEVL